MGHNPHSPQPESLGFMFHSVAPNATITKLITKKYYSKGDTVVFGCFLDNWMSLPNHSPSGICKGVRFSTEWDICVNVSKPEPLSLPLCPDFPISTAFSLHNLSSGIHFLSQEGLLLNLRLHKKWISPQIIMSLLCSDMFERCFKGFTECRGNTNMSAQMLEQECVLEKVNRPLENVFNPKEMWAFSLFYFLNLFLWECIAKCPLSNGLKKGNRYQFRQILLFCFTQHYF